MIYQNIPEAVKCPVCSARSAHLLWSANSRQAAQHFVLKEKYPERFLKLASYIEILWGQDTCDVVQCDNCGFCHSNPYIAGDEKFYTLAYDRTGYPKWKWEYQLTYDVLSNGVASNASILEIGAGDGAFSKRIAENILQKENILCTEFSEYGKRQIETFGLKCVSEDVRNLSKVEYEKNFDIICMFQVLEHMDRLDVLFQKLNWLMKSGGSLFIAVPNSSRIEFNELNGALFDMPPNHIGRWNKKCFEEIGKQNGFHIKDYSVEIESFMSMAIEFMFFRVLQKSQQSGSFVNQLFKVKNRHLLIAIKLMCFAAFSITSVLALTKMNSKLGNSQWVHFIKIN